MSQATAAAASTGERLSITASSSGVNESVMSTGSSLGPSGAVLGERAGSDMLGVYDTPRRWPTSLGRLEENTAELTVLALGKTQAA